jgi:DNA helicase IV
LAHDHLLQGKRVLFTCYNKNLAAFLLSKFEGFENIDVINFHELVRKRCEQFKIPYNVPKEADALPEFFRNRCPELLDQSLNLDTARYDSIIVDEAFDFLDTWWIVLEGLGIPDCAMYAFFDTNQEVFNTKEGWNPPFAAVPIRLETNLRNTRPVGELAAKLGQIADTARYAVDEGPKPQVIGYTTPAEMVQKILKIIGELVKNKVRMDDIVVLAPYKHTSSHVGLAGVVEKNPGQFTTVMSSAPAGKVRIGTIQTFKGLEADVVILCGIDGQLPACKPANLYVGASRARSMLYLLHHSDFKI